MFLDSLKKQYVASRIVAFFVVALVLAIVYSGFLFIKAQGNKTELETAKKAFTWTVIGGAILLGALAIAELLNATVQQVGAGI